MATTPSQEQIREQWLHRLDGLLRDVQAWAEQLGWATKRIEITLSDSQIGKYKAPALLMQEDNIRILVEPVARSAPGAEGVVDLYLMPAYDDIASLYLYDNAWQVHYMFPGTPAVATTGDAQARPLSVETLRDVLESMRENAVQ
jgi:hypothetical protein